MEGRKELHASLTKVNSTEFLQFVSP
uniref:Uncharacterized protein n=1 Tax=Anguilla anguilla TaxID=7936 RepID=A0A0E9SL69_ANGAN